MECRHFQNMFQKCLNLFCRTRGKKKFHKQKSTQGIVPPTATVWVCGPRWCRSPGPQSRHCRSLVADRGDTCDTRAARGAQLQLTSSPPAPGRTNTQRNRENQSKSVHGEQKIYTMHLKPSDLFLFFCFFKKWKARIQIDLNPPAA